MYDDLNETEQRIADYICQNESSIVHDSIQKISKKTHTSQAGIVRFCKKVGFSGLKDVKRHMIIEMTQKEDRLDDFEEDYSDIKTGDSVESVVDKVMVNHLRTLEDTKKILDCAVLDQAINAIQNTDRICFYGTGASGLVASDAHHKFMRAGMMAASYTEDHLMVSSAAALRPGDVAVFISNSGKTDDVIRALKAAKAANATTISITKFGSNPVSDLVDYPLYIASTEIKMRSGATSSRIAQLSVVDMLFIGYGGRNYDSIHPQLEKSIKYFGKTK